MGKDTQYHDKELLDEEGQMQLLVLSEHSGRASKPSEMVTQWCVLRVTRDRGLTKILSPSSSEPVLERYYIVVVKFLLVR